MTTASISAAPTFWGTITESGPESAAIVLGELFKLQIDERFSEANRRNWKPPRQQQPIEATTGEFPHLEELFRP